MTTITITECKSNGRTWTSSHRTTDIDTAIQRAVAKHWGSKCGFWADAGLNRGMDPTTRYGQIVEPCATGGSSSVTARVKIRVEA